MAHLDPSTIRTARDFEQFMQDIWSDHAEPSPNGGGGGMILHMHPQYDEFHDAITVARVCGLPRTGSTRINGEWWDTYLFPDESRIAIQRQGDGCTALTTRFARRRIRRITTE